LIETVHLVINPGVCCVTMYIPPLVLRTCSWMLLVDSKLTVLLHDRKELDDDLGRRTDQDLTLAALLGVVDGVKGIVEDGSLDHFCGCLARFSNGEVIWR
jgi:hypothetical protein